MAEEGGGPSSGVQTSWDITETILLRFNRDLLLTTEKSGVGGKMSRPVKTVVRDHGKAGRKNESRRIQGWKLFRKHFGRVSKKRTQMVPTAFYDQEKKRTV